MKTGLRSAPAWVRTTVVVAGSLALAVAASRVADESSAWGVAVIGAILIGVFAWEVVPVIRAHGATFDTVRNWLRSQSRSLMVLGALSVVLGAVILASVLLD